MSYGSARGIAPSIPALRTHTPLNRQQIVGFWAAWSGWMLDGMDSVIYALVLGPALTELLPRSGIEATPGNIGYIGSVMFAMFLCGLVPVVVSIATLFGVKEPERWKQKHQVEDIRAKRRNPFAVIFGREYVGRTITMSALLTIAIAIVGLWAGTVYESTAIVFLARQAGTALPDAAKLASAGTALLSVGTIIGCIAAPWLAERFGRRLTLAAYYLGMMVTIALAFGWAFYSPVGSALPAFMAVLFFLGLFGGNFAIFSLWLPEQFGTEVRGTAFAFCTSVGRFIGAGVNFALAGAVASMGTLGIPIALTAIAFAIGLLVIPFARETRGQALPD